MKRLLTVVFLASTGLWAQQPGDGPGPGGFSPPPPPMQPDRPPMERSFRARERGRWWTDTALAKKLNLSEDQHKRMDAIFQESRLKLIDLRAALQKQEVILRPLLEADQPNEGQVLAQIDKVAQARAELEKANARMLLGLRSVLTLDQWKQLQAMRFERPMAGRQSDSRLARPDARIER
jgi:periplasmic protein CpxP/Spy